MNALYPIQNSFAAGQLSKKLLGRSDLEVYRQGAKEITNFFPDVRGPLRKRGGSVYMDSFTATDMLIRVRQFSQTSFHRFVFTNLSLVITEHDVADGTNIDSQTIVTTYTVAELQAIRLVHVPESLTTYILHEDHLPAKLTYSSGSTTWTLTAAPTWTAPPAGWGPKYPTVGVFHQGRLWLSGNPSLPEYIWGSKVNGGGAPGQYEDFSLGVAGATDGIEKVITAIGVVRWIDSQNVLLLGTEFGEYIVFASDNTITPTDIHISPQSKYGATAVRTAAFGDQVGYVSADKTKVRVVNFRFQEDSWISKDLAFESDDILSDGVKDIAWAQDPDNLLWILTDTGELRTLSYERTREITGWSKHITSTSVISFDVAILNGKSYLIIGTTHQGGTIDVCIYSYDYFLDNFSRDTAGMPKTTMSGLGRFEGETVTVLVDGAIHTPLIVTGGSITLSYAAQNEIVAGVLYSSTFTTMPFDQYQPVDSRMTDMKRWSKIYLRLYDSGVPLINGKTQRDRSPGTPMGEPEPLTTGDIRITNLGRDRFAEVTVEQDLPLPCNVAALFGKLGTNAL